MADQNRFHMFLWRMRHPLKDNIMKPYPGSQEKGSVKRLFNYRLSRARRVVENVFGIMSAVFRVLRRPMFLEPNKAEIVVLTCVYLHSFLRKNQSSNHIYTPTGTFDSEINGEIIEGSWRQQCSEGSSLTSMQKVGRKPSISAERIRRELAEYFEANGRIPWQDDYP